MSRRFEVEELSSQIGRELLLKDMLSGRLAPFDFAQFLTEHNIWASYNFPNDTPLKCFMGVVEEVGELAHSLLKASDNIRGTPEQHDAKAKDAVGDIVIFLDGICRTKGWNLEHLVLEAWKEVRQRDWVKYPKNGRTE